ncbi:hypothetical protein BJX66DRAFT_319721 [Aspergillus keveii]|uniref:Uncharacterized protein n=1 Tax=Aspergillus keveii TaxID=714993 RepID=A0ABR4FHW7_9EURO
MASHSVIPDDLDRYERSDSLVAHSSAEEDDDDQEDLYGHSGDEDGDKYDDDVDEEEEEDADARDQEEHGIEETLEELEEHTHVHTRGALQILAFERESYSEEVSVNCLVSRDDDEEWKVLDDAEQKKQRERDNGAVRAVRGAEHPSFIREAVGGRAQFRICIIQLVKAFS